MEKKGLKTTKRGPSILVMGQLLPWLGPARVFLGPCGPHAITHWRRDPHRQSLPTPARAVILSGPSLTSGAQSSSSVPSVFFQQNAILSPRAPRVWVSARPWSQATSLLLGLSLGYKTVSSPTLCIAPPQPLHVPATLAHCVPSWWERESSAAGQFRVHRRRAHEFGSVSLAVRRGLIRCPPSHGLVARALRIPRRRIVGAMDPPRTVGGARRCWNLGE
jgi:hypothetical protein